ncbi:RNA polymerase sigma factor [Frigoribacterium sp. UYMn621]|uniref:RNA polymerase sigma factor n=1 Tax=Frigoribacterium sp. UYMn621 TaxID=3156343 RepID=UPI0033936CFB
MAVLADHSGRLRVETLVRAEAGNLLAYFSRRVSPQADAADLLGDTLLVLWRRARSIPENDDEGRMWMFGIARNVLATHRRGLSRRLALADRLRDEMSILPSSGALDGTPQAAPGDDRLEAVVSAMAELSASDREIIMLVHFDGFTLVVAGRLLHLRATAARSRYHRARNRLREIVEAALPADQENFANDQSSS